MRITGVRGVLVSASLSSDFCRDTGWVFPVGEGSRRAFGRSRATMMILLFPMNSKFVVMHAVTDVVFPRCPILNVGVGSQRPRQ